MHKIRKTLTLRVPAWWVPEIKKAAAANGFSPSKRAFQEAGYSAWIRQLIRDNAPGLREKERQAYEDLGL